MSCFDELLVVSNQTTCQEFQKNFLNALFGGLLTSNWQPHHNIQDDYLLLVLVIQIRNTYLCNGIDHIQIELSSFHSQKAQIFTDGELRIRLPAMVTNETL